MATTVSLQLCLLPKVDANASHQPTELLVHVLNRQLMARNAWSTLDDRIFTPDVMCCHAKCADRGLAVDAEDHLLPSPDSQVLENRRDHTGCKPLFLYADCRHHAKSDVDHVQDREQLLVQWILHEAVVGHDDWEVGFFAGLPVVWIVGGSGAYATAAPVAKARVRELVRGLLRRTWNRWERSCFWPSSLPELARAVRQAGHSTERRQVSSAALSTSRLRAALEKNARLAGQWNSLHQNLTTSAHPFPAFPYSSSGGFVSLPPVNFLNGAKGSNLQSGVQHGVVSTPHQSRYLRELVQDHFCASTWSIHDHATFVLRVWHRDVRACDRFSGDDQVRHIRDVTAHHKGLSVIQAIIQPVAEQCTPRFLQWRLVNSGRSSAQLIGHDVKPDPKSSSACSAHVQACHPENQLRCSHHVDEADGTREGDQDHLLHRDGARQGSDCAWCIARLGCWLPQPVAVSALIPTGLPPCRICPPQDQLASSCTPLLFCTFFLQYLDSPSNLPACFSSLS